MNTKSDFSAVLKPGQILYSVERIGLGNTTMKTTSVYTVRIVEVTADYFTASWNNNPARKYFAIPSTWKVKKPFIVQNRLTARKATCEEIKNGHHVEHSTHFAVIPYTAKSAETERPKMLKMRKLYAIDRFLHVYGREHIDSEKLKKHGAK